MSFQIFLDADGVLANFDKLAEEILKMPFNKYKENYGARNAWLRLKNYDNFFGSLELMDNAEKLFNSVKDYNPIILTGCPFGGWAEPQKIYWRDKYFPNTEIICTQSKNKRNHMISNKTNIIIDDSIKYKYLWEEYGGVYILHTSVDNSLLELFRYIKSP